MGLIPCPQCGHQVSPSAPTCPSCGHPIQQARVQKNAAKGGIGCLLFFILIAIGIMWLINEGEKIAEAEKRNPTCRSDYMKCADNDELVRLYQTKQDVPIRVECKVAAERAARFGTPEFSSPPFPEYWRGKSFIDSGRVVLMDSNAKYKNGFNATVNSVATCVHDLKTGSTTVTVN